MNNIDEKYLFVSYSHSEKRNEYFEKFDKFGYNVVFDESISYGENWMFKAMRFISTANCVGCVVLLDIGAFASFAVLQELIYMARYAKKYMAIIVGAESVAQLYEKAKKHYADNDEALFNIEETIKYFPPENVFLQGSVFLNTSVLEQKLKRTFTEWGMPCTLSEETVRQVYYSSEIEGEKERLETQGSGYYRIDMQAIDEVLATFDRDGLLAVDLGCCNGAVTYSRFNDVDKIKTVIGFDKNLQDIEKARAAGYGDKFHFYYLDLEDDRVADKILEKVKEVGHSKIDIVFSALTLLHLTAPENLLLRLFDCFSSDGKIIIRGSDDGSKLCYPNNELMQSILKKYSELCLTTDRYNGRKLFSQLQSCGYLDAHIMYSVSDTCRRNREYRKNLFDVGFLFRKNRIKCLVENNLDNLSLKKDYDAFCLDLLSLEKEFVKPSFWYSVTTYIAIASVN